MVDVANMAVDLCTTVSDPCSVFPVEVGTSAVCQSPGKETGTGYKGPETKQTERVKDMSQKKLNNAGSQERKEGTGAKVARTLIHSVDSVVDFLFIVLMVLLILLAVYAKWDSSQVYTAADPIQYLQYKPSPPVMVPFEELQKINPDVMGWLTVYDTNIDYPVVQSREGNDYYLDHNPKREVEASGSVFLDYRNDPYMHDFNTLIYGHHMAQHEMFGDIDLFLDEEFFNTHEYGNLIYNNQNHGLRFVAILQVDAYDNILYRPGLNNDESKLDYIKHIFEKALYIRGVDMNGTENPTVGTNQEPINIKDHLVLLSTCSADITNGRFVLVAERLDRTVSNPFPEEKHRINSGIDTTKLVYTIGKLSLTTWILILIILILIVVILLVYLKKQRIKKTLRKVNETTPSAKE